MQGSNDQIRSVQIRHWTLNHAFFLYRNYVYSKKLKGIKSYRNKMQGSNDLRRGFMIRRPASPSIILIDGNVGRRMRFQAQIKT